jgi:hypothetical protein
MIRFKFRELTLAIGLLLLAAAAWFADRQAIFDALKAAEARAKVSAANNWRE